MKYYFPLSVRSRGRSPVHNTMYGDVSTLTLFFCYKYSFCLSVNNDITIVSPAPLKNCMFSFIILVSLCNAEGKSLKRKCNLFEYFTWSE